MFIMKSNFKFAEPLANLSEVNLLNDIGVSGILKRGDAKAILQRLVNSSYLEEGRYKSANY
jgi:hypothetical protein